MIREDYIMRMIAQLGEAIRRIAGLTSKGDYDAALRETERGWDEILGVPRKLVDVVDTPTLAGLLGGPQKMRMAAQLLAEEARALRGKNDPVHATICTRRAMELFLEARALDPTPEDDEAILELSRVVHANQLDARYHR